MMKRLICALAAAGMVAASAVGTAGAGGSSGKGHDTITATCTVLGTVTVHVTNGGSSWVGDHLYVLLRFQGTFTPTSGTSQSFKKTFGITKNKITPAISLRMKTSAILFRIGKLLVCPTIALRAEDCLTQD